MIVSQLTLLPRMPPSVKNLYFKFIKAYLSGHELRYFIPSDHWTALEVEVDATYGSSLPESKGISQSKITSF